MIAQTLVNLNAGARSRVAGVVAAITIMAIVLVGAPVIEKIPMAALTGVMMVVSFFTFNWKSFKILNKMPLQALPIYNWHVWQVKFVRHFQIHFLHQARL
mgnify:CR=1 FL=1